MLLVVALVLAALWVDRDRHDPVPPYGIVLAPGFTSYPALDGAPEAGDEAPTFLLPATDGEVVALADHRGEVVVLHFWTTWCLECRDEAPGLSELDAGEGVTVLGIDVGELASRVETAASDLGMTYPVLVDADAEVALAYGVTEYPATVVIDAEGVIRGITYGPIPIAALAEQVAAAGS
jgi:peroxiredoxin